MNYSTTPVTPERLLWSRAPQAQLSQKGDRPSPPRVVGPPATTSPTHRHRRKAFFPNLELLPDNVPASKEVIEAYPKAPRPESKTLSPLPMVPKQLTPALPLRHHVRISFRSPLPFYHPLRARPRTMKVYPPADVAKPKSNRRFSLLGSKQPPVTPARPPVEVPKIVIDEVEDLPPADKPPRRSTRNRNLSVERPTTRSRTRSLIQKVTSPETPIPVKHEEIVASSPPSPCPPRKRKREMTDDTLGTTEPLKHIPTLDEVASRPSVTTFLDAIQDEMHHTPLSSPTTETALTTTTTTQKTEESKAPDSPRVRKAIRPKFTPQNSQDVLLPAVDDLEGSPRKRRRSFSRKTSESTLVMDQPSNPITKDLSSEQNRNGPSKKRPAIRQLRSRRIIRSPSATSSDES